MLDFTSIQTQSPVHRALCLGRSAQLGSVCLLTGLQLYCYRFVQRSACPCRNGSSVHVCPMMICSLLEQSHSHETWCWRSVHPLCWLSSALMLQRHIHATWLERSDLSTLSIGLSVVTVVAA